VTICWEGGNSFEKIHWIGWMVFVICNYDVLYLAFPYMLPEWQHCQRDKVQLLDIVKFLKRKKDESRQGSENGLF